MPDLTQPPASELLRALDERATPGTWKQDRAPRFRRHILQYDSNGEWIQAVADTCEEDDSGPDAALICALRNALPALVELVEAAEEAREVEDYVLSEYEPEGTDLQRALANLRKALGGAG